MSTPNTPTFVVCINNADYPAALERRKIYQRLPDPQAETHALLRIIDESGEDYLYPSSLFLAVDLSQQVQQALVLAA